MRKILFLAVTVLALAACGGKAGQGTGTDSTAVAATDSLAAEGLSAESDNVDAGPAFIEQFYDSIRGRSDADVDAIVSRSLTANAKAQLSDSYVFYRESNIVFDMHNSSITHTDIERLTKDMYRVTLDIDPTQYDTDYRMKGCIYRYSLTIGLVKDGDSYKIDGISARKGNPVCIIGGAKDPYEYAGRYLAEMNRQASKAMDKELWFFEFAVMDIDGDGTAEILGNTDGDFPIYGAFAVGSGKPELLVCFNFQGSFVFYEHAVGWQGGCGTCCQMGEYAVVKDSRLATKYRLMDQYDMSEEANLVPDECVYQQDGKDISSDEAYSIFKPGGALGKHYYMEPVWLQAPGM